MYWVVFFFICWLLHSTCFIMIPWNRNWEQKKSFFLILSFYRYLLFTCLIPNKRKPPPIWKCSYVIKDKYYCAVSILENNLIGLFPRMTSTLWLAMPHCRKPVIPNHVLLYSQTPAFQASSEFPIILICHSLYTTYILSQWVQ